MKNHASIIPQLQKPLSSNQKMRFLIIVFQVNHQSVLQYQIMEQSANQSSYYEQDSSQNTQSIYSQQIEQKAIKIENDLCQYLQLEYHDAILSDANFVPSDLVDKVNQLQQSLTQQISKQADLNEEVNNLTFQLHKIDAQIQAYEELQASTAKIQMQEDVGKKQQQFKETLNYQQLCQEETNHLEVQTQRLQMQIEQKRKNEEELIKYLAKAMRKEEDSIRLWEKKIADLKNKIQNQNAQLKASGGPQRSREAAKKMQEDRKVALRQNITKLKQYIQMNEEYLRQ